MKLLTFALLLLINTTLNLSAHANSFQEELTESPNLVKAGEKYVTLLGTQVAVGETAPNFKVVDGNFTPVQLSSFSEDIVLISVVPSLDTGVCSIQTKRFNEEVENLPANITMLTISNDLPFAQKRFVSDEDISNVTNLSDFKTGNFGKEYGLEMISGALEGLHSRAVIVLDEDGTVIHSQQVPEIGDEPNYEAALKAL
mgnify:CR=1 FL=1